MNTINNPEEENPNKARPLAPKERTARRRSNWVRHILAGNPLYLVSAALLLFGINRLSVDPEFLGAEEAKLGFNFSALQIYEILLVTVGIFLARRRIWYDSTLLVGLENLLAVVPFILVTQAFLIGNSLALGLCVAGTFMAVLRFASLRRYIPELNMPPRLLCLGSVVLTINLALPVYFRWLLKDGTTDFWEQPNQFCWLTGLPLLQLLALFLAPGKRLGDIAAQQRWVPLAMLETWVAATAVHLWCVSYVAKIAFQPYLLAPLLWALAWTVYKRLEDFTIKPLPRLRIALLISPAFLTLLGAFHEASYVFFGLTFLNAIIYVCLFAYDHKKEIAFQLLLASLVGLIAGVPWEIGQILIPEFSRGRSVALALGAYVMVGAFFSKRPHAGFCAAIVAAIAPAFFGPEAQVHLFVQAGFALLLVHSLRWIDHEHKGAAPLRIITAVAWMAHSLATTHNDAASAKWVISASIFVLAFYAGARLMTGLWGARIVPAAALVCFLAAPANYFLRKLLTSPAGVLAIIGSFVLFGLGTLLALSKQRWQPRPGPRVE